MFVFSRFLARATSWSVTLVQIRILEKTNKCITPCSPTILIPITKTDLLILLWRISWWKIQSLCCSFFCSHNLSPFVKNRCCSPLAGKCREAITKSEKTATFAGYLPLIHRGGVLSLSNPSGVRGRKHIRLKGRVYYSARKYNISNWKYSRTSYEATNQNAKS